MADVPLSVKVDGKAFIKYPKLTEDIRASLRAEIPAITKDLADRVRDKLAPGALFKTTDRLLPAVSSRMIENTNQIYGTVYIDSNKFPSVVAHTLESGSRAHDIVPVNASALAFFWEKLGINAVFRKVHHPGFEGRSYMQSSLDEMQSEITERMTDAVKTPASA
jgi:hypothetical protein